MKETYAFSLDYYGERFDKIEKIRGFVSAENYTDAVREISATFSDISNLHIDVLFESGGFVFVDDEETFNKLIKENTY